VVEVTGSPDGFDSALSLVRPLGTLVLKSTFAERLRDFDVSSLVVDEITIVGSRCGPFERALAAMETHTFDVRRLINACYPLRDGLQAFAHASRKGVLKVLMEPKD
jgi:threonine dehydrogenase-like Zn-dependent dehydrogenase